MSSSWISSPSRLTGLIRREAESQSLPLRVPAPARQQSELSTRQTERRARTLQRIDCPAAQLDIAEGCTG